MSWLLPVVSALDARTTPVTIFWRDDDAGWDTPALERLVERFHRQRVPVDLAVIPAELDRSLADRLLDWRATGLVGLHQHGFSHHNRQTTGRKCEFGSARPLGRIAADIARGRRRLDDLLGDAADPIFTPPWNRCVDDVADVLATLGFRAISRDRSAGTIGHPGLAELPVAVDWFGSHRGVRWARSELGRRLAAELIGDGPVGIMLHHAVSDADELRHLEDLLGVLGDHPKARSVPMRALVAQVSAGV